MATGSTTTTLWYTWAAATSTATCGDTWVSWTETGTSTSTSSTASDVWIKWADSSSTSWQVQKPRELTAEEKAAQEAARKKAEEDRQKREAARLAAELTALKLFKEHLDEEQQRTYELDKKFWMVGSDGNRYEVDCRQSHGNIFELDEQGKRRRSYCIYAPNVPLPDNHLAQKLLLEADAEQFKKIANARDLVPAMAG